MAGNRKNELPGSIWQIQEPEAREVVDITDKIGLEGANTIKPSNFRVERQNSEMATRADRLREAVRRAGRNKVVASKSGVPLSTLSDYLTGKEWKVSPALALAEACGVSLEWLVTGREVDPKSDGTTLVAPASDSYIAIPRLDVRVSAGSGNEAGDEALIGHLALDEAFLRNHLGRRRENLVSIEASGDSMDPTIRDGDMLVVDTTAKDIQDSRIYIIDVNGRLLVKRIQLRMDGSLLIKSDNPKYEPEIVMPSDRNPLRIIGQVVYQAGPPRS